MKPFSMVVVTLLCTSNLLAQQRIHARQNERLQLHFSHYKTFDVDTNGEALENFAFTRLGTHSFEQDGVESGIPTLNRRSKTVIGDEIVAAMEERGYFIKKNEPDLVVTFKVFDGSATIPWSKEERGTGGDEVADTISYAVKAGTLLVSVIDNDLNAIVWQGFVSGLNDDNMNFTTNKARIYYAIQQLISNFVNGGYGLSAR